MRIRRPVGQPLAVRGKSAANGIRQTTATALTSIRQRGSVASRTT